MIRSSNRLWIFADLILCAKFMSIIAFPTPVQAATRRRIAWIAFPSVGLLAAVIYFVATRNWTSIAAPDAAAQVYTVAAKDFEVMVNQKGELQATNNIDII